MNHKIHSARRLCVIAILGALAQGASADDSPAWATYQQFVNECRSATSMETLLPVLSSWRRDIHESSNEEERKSTLERICGASNILEDIRFASEEDTYGGKVLQLTAVWDGDAMAGRVTVLTEGDALKVEDWSWVTRD